MINFLLNKWKFFIYNIKLSALQRKFDNPTTNKCEIVSKFIFDPHWEERINRICWSPYNQKIERVSNAGNIANGFQVLHNGLKIKAAGYYGLPISKALVKNKGVHEPFEEYYFGEILKKIGKGSTMIELGSYWSFYSMWFKKRIPQSNVYMIEPESSNLEVGKINFKENEFDGFFFQYFIVKSELNQIL